MIEIMKIAISSDHAGVDLRKKIIGSLGEGGIEFLDSGTDSKDSVDYPDYGIKVVEAISSGKAEKGILICGTGIGMSIVANKFPGIRAALCYDISSTELSRRHNDANIMVIGARSLEEKLAIEMVSLWLKTEFEGGRHKRRIDKIQFNNTMPWLKKTDIDIYNAIKMEVKRENEKIVLIPSENYVSKAILEAQGSLLTNKYAEGYIGKRYYGGCEYVDVVESLAINRAKELFKSSEHVNVQPHSGSQANMAVYFSVLKPGDTIMGMDLSQGGHLTHGSHVNFSGIIYKPVYYGVNRETGVIDYNEMAEIAEDTKPKMIVAGASSYSRILDFKRFREIADRIGAYLMVDIAHIAGMVATSIHPSPIPYADFVTGTTHKTLRGPRGGFILCKERFARAVDKTIFPGIQGGPLMHIIAAKATSFKEAMSEEFKDYQRQVVTNARILASKLIEYGFKIVSGGTDTHLMLIDLTDKEITGKDAEALLDEAGITVNKNSIPHDKRPPAVTSGIRIGTPIVTTRGMKEPEMLEIAEIIKEVLNNINDKECSKEMSKMAQMLCKRFPFRR